VSDDVRDHLLAIRAERAELTAATVVAAATPKSHPLHDRFEWDNRVAGHQYRLVQAAELIRTVHVEVVIDDRPEKVRAFVSVPRPEGRRYEPTDEVAQDPFARTLVLREMERDWRSLRRRWEHETAFMAMVSADLAST
jgi:hypothetical protein